MSICILYQVQVQLHVHMNQVDCTHELDILNIFTMFTLTPIVAIFMLPVTGCNPGTGGQPSSNYTSDF